MKTLVLSVFLACAVGCPIAVASSAARPAPSMTDSSKTSKPSVQKGMTAEAVVALIGRPSEIKPIVTEAGTGESWIYRRVAKRMINPVAPTVEKVPAWGGPGLPNGEIVIVDVPFQRIERVTIYQMTALLFVDGKVVASKQWLDRDQHFD